MSLDSRLRLARRKGAGARIHPHEIPTICEAMQLLRACERAERSEDSRAPSTLAEARVAGWLVVRVFVDGVKAAGTITMAHPEEGHRLELAVSFLEALEVRDELKNL